MNVDKRDEEEIGLAAELFRLLADPTRVAILDTLAGGRELAVGELAERCGRRPSTMSQHLAKLRMARVVTTRRDGTTVYYRAGNEHVVRLVADALGHAEHLGPGTPRHHSEGEPG